MLLGSRDMNFSKCVKKGFFGCCRGGCGGCDALQGLKINMMTLLYKYYIIPQFGTIMKGASTKRWFQVWNYAPLVCLYIYIYGQYFYFPVTFVGRPLRIAPNFGMLWSIKKWIFKKIFSPHRHLIQRPPKPLFFGLVFF